MLPMNNGVKLALNWLAQSDIYHANGQEEALGGVNQGYNWQQKRYPFIYSEITGYAITVFVNAYRWTGNEQYLTQACQSADFLLKVQSSDPNDASFGAIAHGLSLPGLELRRQYYSFDAAMCLQGLLDLHAVAPTPKILETSRRVGNWLMNRMQQDNGAFLALYNADTGETHHQNGNFFDDNGCLHAKHAIGLLKLGRATGDERYTTAAQKVCNWVLTLQHDDGAFQASEQLPQVVTHPHCYATEGLLFAHHILEDARYLEAARKAGRWLLAVQNKDGSVNIEYKRRWWRMGRRVTEKLFPLRVTDATAQALRIWLILYYLDQDDTFLEGCHRAKRFLQKMQCTASPDKNAVGGFYFWPGHPIMFTWATMFALNALYGLDNIEREQGYQQTITELL